MPDSAPVAAPASDTGRPWYPEGDEYMAERLRGPLSLAPGLVWVVPPHRLITERRYATPRTLGSHGLESWTLQDSLSEERAKQVRREQHVACESSGPLFEYRGEGPSVEFAERVFLVDSAPAVISAGLVNVPADSAWVSPALATLLRGRPDAAHRDTAFGAVAGGEFYSFHGAYDTSANADAEMGTKGERYLVRRALVLHDRSGAAIASRVRDVDTPECDGCGVPTIADDFQTVSAVLQVLQLPGFPHAVLLLNTSTVEGRALSLETFDESGERRTYRVYEYVVNCF